MNMCERDRERAQLKELDNSGRNSQRQKVKTIAEIDRGKVGRESVDK